MKDYSPDELVGVRGLLEEFFDDFVEVAFEDLAEDEEEFRCGLASGPGHLRPEVGDLGDEEALHRNNLITKNL